MEVSNCCNESIVEETDICSKCGEHCEAVDDFDEAMKLEGKSVTYNGELIK